MGGAVMGIHHTLAARGQRLFLLHRKPFLGAPHAKFPGAWRVVGELLWGGGTFPLHTWHSASGETAAWNDLHLAVGRLGMRSACSPRKTLGCFPISAWEPL
jgi:hypothetical protein